MQPFSDTETFALVVILAPRIPYSVLLYGGIISDKASLGTGAFS